jgi:hypothetical protein
MEYDSVIVIDNFLSNIDTIRSEALSLKYTKSEIDTKGWKGYRCLDNTDLANDICSLVKQELVNRNSLFTDIDIKSYFHYTTSDTDISNKIHKDFESDYAGVLYLTPNAPTNTGTAIYNDMGIEISNIENIYNRLTIYPANLWHALKDTFGNDIETGRLTLTMFISFNQKKEKSII